jgi:ATP-dependent Clp protease ATP-binding subunit ClpA
MEIENITPAVERILKMAAIEARKDHSYIGAEHVLIGMILEGKNGVSLMLKDAGFTAEQIRECRMP